MAGYTKNPRRVRLTPRQRDVLRELKRGCTEAQAARRLGIKKNTVHVYAKSIYRRFNVHTRAELLVRCLRPVRRRYAPVVAKRG